MRDQVNRTKQEETCLSHCALRGQVWGLAKIMKNKPRRCMQRITGVGRVNYVILHKIHLALQKWRSEGSSRGNSMC